MSDTAISVEELERESARLAFEGDEQALGEVEERLRQAELHEKRSVLADEERERRRSAQAEADAAALRAEAAERFREGARDSVRIVEAIEKHRAVLVDRLHQFKATGQRMRAAGAISGDAFAADMHLQTVLTRLLSDLSRVSPHVHMDLFRPNPTGESLAQNYRKSVAAWVDAAAEHEET